MRTATVLALLSLIIFVEAITHSSTTVQLQPGEVKYYSLYKQTGTIAVRILSGDADLEVKLSCEGTYNTVYTEQTLGDDNTHILACYRSDEYISYIFLQNTNNNTAITTTFQVEVTPPVDTVNQKASFSLPTNGFQYIRIPAQPNHGLSFDFNVECDFGNNHGIKLLAKTQSATSFPLFSPGYFFSENEDILVLIQDIAGDGRRECTFTYVSRETIVLHEGENILTIPSGGVAHIGARYIPSSSEYMDVSITTSGLIIPIEFDVDYRRIERDGFLTFSTNPQYLIFMTSSLNEGNVTVTINATSSVEIINGEEKSFQCIANQRRRFYVRSPNENSGLALEISAVQNAKAIETAYTTSESRFISVGTTTVSGVVFGDGTNNRWILDFTCDIDGISTLTATIPEFQMIGLGKTVVNVGTTKNIYLKLPEGPNQASLGVHVNSSSIKGFYYGGSFSSMKWSFNTNQKTDVSYAAYSKTETPAWYFVLNPLDVPETIEITLTATPIIVLENGKMASSIAPDDSYDKYWRVAKIQGSKALGHSLQYQWQTDITENGFLFPFENSIGATGIITKRDADTFSVYFASPFTNSTFYFVFRADSTSTFNLTATFTPVLAAVNGSISIVHDPNTNERDAVAFEFPVMKHHNALFRGNATGSIEFKKLWFSGRDDYRDVYGSSGFEQLTKEYIYSFGKPDSIGIWGLVMLNPAESGTMYIESIPGITLCSSLLDCNGHGSCAEDGDSCNCTDGYSGDYCDISPPSSDSPSISDDNDNNSSGERLLASVVCAFAVLFTMSR